MVTVAGRVLITRNDKKRKEYAYVVYDPCEMPEYNRACEVLLRGTCTGLCPGSATLSPFGRGCASAIVCVIGTAPVLAKICEELDGLRSWMAKKIDGQYPTSGEGGYAHHTYYSGVRPEELHLFGRWFSKQLDTAGRGEANNGATYVRNSMQIIQNLIAGDFFANGRHVLIAGDRSKNEKGDTVDVYGLPYYPRRFSEDPYQLPLRVLRDQLLLKVDQKYVHNYMMPGDSTMISVVILPHFLKEIEIIARTDKISPRSSYLEITEATGKDPVFNNYKK
jgi:hypothetical protein